MKKFKSIGGFLLLILVFLIVTSSSLLAEEIYSWPDGEPVTGTQELGDSTTLSDGSYCVNNFFMI